MESFRGVLSVLKRLLIGIFAVFFFAATVVGVINGVRPGTFSETRDFDGLGDWLLAMVGPLLVAWVLKDSLWTNSGIRFLLRHDGIRDRLIAR